ncbi:hypothetical protein ACH4E7_40415 [Kitasatospora sp. NPDC018058]|uniref:hypothetical protein n=1 Tax=Kitasatospora sp. NPDC018058 TaxID=3364025 RepID=UPI0037C06BCB
MINRPEAVPDISLEHPLLPLVRRDAHSLARVDRGPLGPETVARLGEMSLEDCSAAALPIAGSQLAGKLTGLGPTGPGVPKAVVASALLLAISSLIGMALGALIRHPAGAVTATWSALLFVPELLGSGSINLSAAAEGMPVQLWTAISHTQPPSLQPAPLAPTPVAWLLYAAWPTISVAVTVWIVRRRDV